MDARTKQAPTGLISAIEAAVQAPSMHNTQPWRFRVAGDTIDVHIDPQRVLAVADPTWRAARIACGAAILNLRLAIAVSGRSATVALTPDPHTPTLAARVTLGTPRPPTAEEQALFHAVRRRHSNRYPFLDLPIPLEHRARLRAAAQREAGWLDFLLGPAAIHTACELVRTADQQLNRNPLYQAEVVEWTRHRADSASDGVPDTAGGPAPVPHELLTRRDFGGQQQSCRDYEAEPMIGVLGGLNDSPTAQLTAGRALQRVLLTATHHGLAASLISQPIEVPQVREQLRIGLARYSPPQIMLRIGHGTPSPGAPRRPVTDVLEIVD